MGKINEWQKKSGEISHQGLMDLFHNQCAYIAVENFLTIKECEVLVNTLRLMGLQQYDYQFDVNGAPPAA